MAATAPGIYTIRNDREKRTVYVSMRGSFDLATMQEAYEVMTAATDEYAGQPHFFAADLRGLDPVFGAVGNLMGEGIAYCRQHGVVACAHLSDNAITRLQAANLARAATQGDDITVDVVSEDEAEAFLEEMRRMPKFRVA